MLDNEGTGDNFILGFDDGAIGDTRDLRGDGRPHLDAQPHPRARRQLRHQPHGPDGDRPRLRHELRPRARDPRRRTAASDALQRPAPRSTTATPIGDPTPSWMPLFRKERSWTFSTALTKVLPKHEMRAGFDFVRHELNHYQAEFGDYGAQGRLQLRRPASPAPPATRQLQLEPVRRLPARPAATTTQGRAGDRDDGPREAVRALRARPLERQPAS